MPDSAATNRESGQPADQDVSLSAQTDRGGLDEPRSDPGDERAGSGGRMPPGLASRFETVELLGRGGMGAVFLCRDKQLARDVAVKVILGSGEGLERRLRREAQVLAGLEHQNVVRLYDFGTADGQPYVVMEYVRGKPLSSRLALGRPTVVESVRLCREIVAGVAVAHERGIAHFDLKPGNIFLDQAGVAKVADFGLARAVSDEAADPKKREAIGGTPGYMAPEQWHGQAGLPADVYAIGVILREMLTGRRLFAGIPLPETLRLQLQGPLPEASSMNPSVPPFLDDLVTRCLARDPAARPSLEELGSRLGDWLERVTRSRRQAVEAGFPAHPYRFLDAFGVADAPIYFGRDAETTELAALIDQDAVRLILMFGPCGVGKSSLVRAGLARAVGAAHLLVVLVSGPAPARRILEALAARAAAAGVALDGRAPTPDALAAEPRLRRELLTALAGAKGRLVLAVDQVEEVFTQNPPGSRAAADLFELVSEIAGAPAAPVKLVLAYRNEFRAEFFPLEQRLAHLVQSCAVGEIDAPRLVEAIEGPSLVEHYDFAYEPGLPERLAADIAETSSRSRSPALPALQIVCRQLHDRMRAGGARVIDRRMYEADLGGAEGALERYVRDRLAGPAYAHQGALARQILEALTIREPEGERYSCPRDLEDLLDFADRAEARRTFDQLVADRMVTQDTGEDGRIEARLASEVICPVIDGWTAEPDPTQAAGRVLARACRVWLEHARSPEHLLDGPLLAQVAGHIDNLRSVGEGERAFVARSVARARRVRAARASVAALVALLALGWLWAAWLRPGSLELTSDPPGARVWRGRELMGVTPLSRDVWPGGVPLRFELEHHDPLAAEVVVHAGGVTAFGPALRYTRGVLDVRSDPPDARVSIAPVRGEPVAAGTTPLTTEVERGLYTVTVALPGWETRTLEGVEVRDKRQLTHRLVKLARNSGWLLARTPRENARLVLTDPRTGRVAVDAALPLREPLAVSTGSYLAECIPVQGGRVDYRSVEMGVRTTHAVSPWIPAAGALWTVRGISPVLAGTGADLDGDGSRDLLIGSRGGAVHALSGSTGHELWRHRTGGAVVCAPAAADLDGDGVLDAVATSHDGKTHAISGRTGEPLWTHVSGAKMQVNPALGDLDHDGVPDVVVASTDRRVYALRGRSGELLWSAATGGAVYSDAALADLDGDGTLDVLVGSNDGRVHALTGKSGAVLWTSATGGPIASSTLVARLDADAVPDALVLSSDRTLRALEGRTGRELWRHRSVDGTPLLVDDVDGDRVPDAVCVAADYHGVEAVSGASGRTLWTFHVSGNLWPQPALAAGPGGARCVVVSSTSQVYVLARDGRPLWGVNPGGPLSGPPSIVDLDGDGLDDLVCPVGDSLIAVPGSLGQHRWAFQAGGLVRAQPLLVPLDGDGEHDVVVGAGDRVLYALSGRTGEPLWSRDLGSEISAGLAAADLDRDGRPDVVVSSEDGRVHAASGRDGRALWAHDAGGLVETRAALADLDADGAPDAVVGTGKGALLALSGRDGTALWTHAGAAYAADPAIADLDGDGAPDVVAADVDGRVVALAGRTGKPLWTAATAGAVKRGIAAGDLDGDGRPEVLIAAESGAVRALDARSGALRWVHRAGAAVESAPLILAGAGEADVVIARVDGVLSVLAGRGGAVRWTRRFAGEGRFREEPPAAVDLDGDGRDDLLVAHGDGIFGLERRTGRPLFRTGERFVGYGQPQVHAGQGSLALVTCSAATVVRRTLDVPAPRPAADRRLWRLTTGAPITGSPAVGDLAGDGARIAVVGGVDGRVYAVAAADGAARWTHDAGSAVRSSPALVPRTTPRAFDVVAGADDGRVVALDGATGAVRWRFDAGAAVVASPAVGDVDGDGGSDVVVGTMAGRLLALPARGGAPLWSLEAGAAIVSSPALADADGDGAMDVVFAVDDGTLRACRARDGSPLWKVPLAPRPRSSPAVIPGPAGPAALRAGTGQPALIVCGAGERGVVALSGRDGAVVWCTPVRASVESSPALADLDGDGRTDVAIGSSDGGVHALSGPDGRVLWTRRTGARVRGRPATGDVDGDGKPDVVVGSSDGLVHAFAGASGRRLFVRSAGGAVDWSGPALVDADGDGALDAVVGNQAGELVAISGSVRARR